MLFYLFCVQPDTLYNRPWQDDEDILRTDKDEVIAITGVLKQHKDKNSSCSQLSHSFKLIVSP